ANAQLTSTGRDSSPVWTYADTLSWTKGAHAFRFGGEFRFPTSTSTQYCSAFFCNNKSIPQAYGGATALGALATTGGIGINNTNSLLSTLGTTNATRARDMLNFFTGSLSSITQLYFLTDPNNVTKWSDWRDAHLITTKTVQKEFDLFFKDDYKIR